VFRLVLSCLISDSILGLVIIFFLVGLPQVIWFLWMRLGWESSVGAPGSYLLQIQDNMAIRQDNMTKVLFPYPKAILSCLIVVLPCLIASPHCLVFLNALPCPTSSLICLPLPCTALANNILNFPIWRICPFYAFFAVENIDDLCELPRYKLRVGIFGPLDVASFEDLNDRFVSTFCNWRWGQDHDKIGA
jgi:hypothetical protein